MEKGETTEFKLDLHGTIETDRIPELVEKLGSLITNLNIDLNIGGSSQQAEKEQPEIQYLSRVDFQEFASSRFGQPGHNMATKIWHTLSATYSKHLNTNPQLAAKRVESGELVRFGPRGWDADIEVSSLKRYINRLREINELEGMQSVTAKLPPNMGKRSYELMTAFVEDIDKTE